MSLCYTDLFSEDVAFFMASPVREIFRKVDLNAIYSFAGGYPSANAFPLEQIKEISAKVIEKYGANALQYGATGGLNSLREILSLRYHVPFDNIQITTSSQQGIDVCTRILVDPGDVILTHNPTYLGALQSFKSYRAEVVAIDDLNELASTVEALKKQKKKIKFFYSIPDFQNPSGETLTFEQREKLLQVAQEQDFLIIEDSPYRELRYSGEEIPTIYSLDNERVIFLGSFSKIFAPGFRLGWIFGPKAILEKIYICKQSLDLCPPVFDQHIAYEYLVSGALDENLKKSIALYRSKRDLLMQLLERHMPKSISWTKAEGGLFLFLYFPKGFDTVKFYDRALSNGVAYVAGSFFHIRGGENTMRLNFSFMSEEKIIKGVELLATLVKEELAALNL